MPSINYSSSPELKNIFLADDVEALQAFFHTGWSVEDSFLHNKFQSVSLLSIVCEQSAPQCLRLILAEYQLKNKPIDMSDFNSIVSRGDIEAAKLICQSAIVLEGGHNKLHFLCFVAIAKARKNENAQYIFQHLFPLLVAQGGDIDTFDQTCLIKACVDNNQHECFKTYVQYAPLELLERAQKKLLIYRRKSYQAPEVREQAPLYQPHPLLDYLDQHIVLLKERQMLCDNLITQALLQKTQNKI